MASISTEEVKKVVYFSPKMNYEQLSELFDKGGNKAVRSGIFANDDNISELSYPSTFSSREEANKRLDDAYETIKTADPTLSEKEIWRVVYDAEYDARIQKQYCRYGPRCTKGEKCLRKHKNDESLDCVFGTKCRAIGCPKSHPGGKECLFGPFCNNINCPFLHIGQICICTRGELFKLCSNPNCPLPHLINWPNGQIAISIRQCESYCHGNIHDMSKCKRVHVKGLQAFPTLALCPGFKINPENEEKQPCLICQEKIRDDHSYDTGIYKVDGLMHCVEEVMTHKFFTIKNREKKKY